MSQLIEKYQYAVDEQEIVFDAAQYEVLLQLQRLNDHLIQAKPPWWKIWQSRPVIEGLYIYGPVGTGKTFLVDLFFQNLPQQYAKRFHFIHFMQLIDQELRKRQGEPDPLRQIIKDFANQTQVLCFDEFEVNDVAHAMILAELLDAFFANHLILIATSNTPPDELYQKGVQRQRFLPAIEAIKQHCQINSLVAKRDYRIGRAIQIETYLYPLTQAHNLVLEKQFQLIARNSLPMTTLVIQNREIQCIKSAANLIWFDFNQICQIPRSQLDYLELSQRYPNFIISHVKQMGPDDTRQAILWIQLIDVLYDQNRRIIISAEVPIDDLYLGGEMAHDFKRTISRLHEMQSMTYQNKAGYVSSDVLIRPGE